MEGLKQNEQIKRCDICGRGHATENHNEEMISDPDKIAKILEQEISLEAIKNAMEKVKDILNFGTAFLHYAETEPKIGYVWENKHNLQYIGSAIQNGVMGLHSFKSEYKKDEWSEDEARKAYAQSLKPKTEHSVYFNVIGRSWNEFNRSPLSNLGGVWGGGEDTVSIIFDSTKYREVPMPLDQKQIDYVKYEIELREVSNKYPVTMYFDGREKPPEPEEIKAIRDRKPEYVSIGVGNTSEVPLGSYFPDDIDCIKRLLPKLIKRGITKEEDIRKALTSGSEFLREMAGTIEFNTGSKIMKEGRVNDDGEIMPNTEYGFVLRGRIQPRNIQGMAITTAKPEIKSLQEEIVEDDTKQVERAEFLAKMQQYIHPNNPELAFPIYDIKGNLLWPKEMTRAEIIEHLKEKEVEKESED